MKYLAICFLTLTTSIYAQVEPTTAESASTIATGKFDFTFTPSAFYVFGKTEYDFHLTVPVVDTSGALVDYTVRSLLEFPLDALMAGASFGVVSPEGANRPWSAKIGVYTNLSDPGKLMKDSDWETLENNFPTTLFSYTESDVKMDMILVNAEITKELFSNDNAGISLLIGYRYQKIEQNIIGYNGWYLDSNDMKQTLSGTEPALDYMVTYKGLQVGALTNVEFGQNLQITIKTAASFTYVNDKDDHLLRKFYTTSNGLGIGFVSQLGARWYNNLYFMKHQTFIDFVGGYDYYEANLSKTWVQYADGGPLNPPVGNTLGGLPHYIKSRQFSFGLRFGLVF